MLTVSRVSSAASAGSAGGGRQGELEEEKLPPQLAGADPVIPARLHRQTLDRGPEGALRFGRQGLGISVMKFCWIHWAWFTRMLSAARWIRRWP